MRDFSNTTALRFQTQVPLAPLTTLGIGGVSQFFVEAYTEKDIEAAVAYARAHHLSLFPLGNGSNVLVPDSGVAGLVVKMSLRDLAFQDGSDEALLVAGAGVAWDSVVDYAAERGFFGVENLAGIPGTVGGAAVQNIGAYGAELADVFEYADVLSSVTGARRRISRAEASFAYRTSFFKEHKEYIILQVAVRLAKAAVPNIAYADLAQVHASGESLSTPADIARAVRAIREKKFPKNPEEGTAGSFFKNPVVSPEVFSSLAQRFPDLPSFAQKDGTKKIPLAWILDKVLSLKGFARERVRLYENHSLIVVAKKGARAAEVDAFVSEISARVFQATGITIEREVETFGAQK